MARQHRLSEQEKIKGWAAAARSHKTPPQLRKALRAKLRGLGKANTFGKQKRSPRRKRSLIEDIFNF